MSNINPAAPFVPTFCEFSMGIVKSEPEDEGIKEILEGFKNLNLRIDPKRSLNLSTSQRKISHINQRLEIQKKSREKQVKLERQAVRDRMNVSNKIEQNISRYNAYNNPVGLRGEIITMLFQITFDQVITSLQNLEKKYSNKEDKLTVKDLMTFCKKIQKPITLLKLNNLEDFFKVLKENFDSKEYSFQETLIRRFASPEILALYRKMEALNDENIEKIFPLYGQ